MKKDSYVCQLRNTFSVIYTTHKNRRVKNHRIGFQVLGGRTNITLVPSEEYAACYLFFQCNWDFISGIKLILLLFLGMDAVYSISHIII